MTYWDDSLLVGIPQIDSGHRKLLDSIGKLMDACAQGKSRAEIAQALNSIVSHAKDHIRDEENLQEWRAYPGINAHKRAHAQFCMQVEALEKELETTGPNVALIAKFNKTLVVWYINHISTEDKKLCEYINSKP